MAIPLVHAKIISRSKGRSLAAAFAYMAAMHIMDMRQGLEFDYTRKGGVLETGIAAPQNAPSWVYDPNKLVNAIEAAEKRVDGRTAREMIIALPCEMDDKQRSDLLKDYINQSFTSEGMVASYAIHAPDREGDDRNFHAHVILTTREITPDGFKVKKNRNWDKDETLEAWKTDYRDLVLERGKELGLDISMESFDRAEREALGLQSTLHMGEELTKLERKGIKTGRGNHNREIERENQQARELNQELDQAKQQLEMLLHQQAELENVPALELVDEQGQAQEIVTEPPALEQVITLEIAPEPVPVYDDVLARYRREEQERLREELRELAAREEQQPEPVRGHEIPQISVDGLGLELETGAPEQVPTLEQGQEHQPSLTQEFNSSAEPQQESFAERTRRLMRENEQHQPLELTPEIDLPGQQPERPTQPFNQAAGQELAQEQEPEPQTPTLEMQQSQPGRRQKKQLTRQEWVDEMRRKGRENDEREEQGQAQEPERPTSPFNEAAGQEQRKPGQKLIREEWVEKMKRKGRENDEREEQERKQNRGFDLEM